MNTILFYALLSLSSIDLCQVQKVSGPVAHELNQAVGGKKFSRFDVSGNKKLASLKSMKGIIHEGSCRISGKTTVCRYCLKGNPQ